MCRYAAAVLLTSELYLHVQEALCDWERVFQKVDQPILVFDKEFRILRANQATVRLAGKASLADLEGQSGAELLYGRAEAPRSCLVQQVLRTGRSASGFRILPRLGGRHHLTVHPTPGPGGAPVGAVLLARNVTREMELEGRFRGLVENSNALFLVPIPGA